MKTYTAKMEQDEDGVWCGVVDLGKHKSAISDGPTLERARERIREAVSLMEDVAEEQVQIELDVSLPKSAARLVAAAKAAAEKAEKARGKATEATKGAALALVAAGLSRRDVGELLGVTRQRASQIIGGLDK